MEWSFKSVPAIRAAVKSSGSHYFDADTMRFFGTKYPSNVVWAGRIFVLSHQPPHGPRVYGVHIVERREDGFMSIQNAEDMLSDSPTTLAGAKAIAEYLAYHYAENWPDHFDYEQAQDLYKVVTEYRERKGIE